MANKYKIHSRYIDEVIEVEKRKLTIRDNYIQVNGARIGENKPMSLILPLTSIAFIEETQDPDSPGVKIQDKTANVKQWRFGTEPPKGD